MSLTTTINYDNASDFTFDSTKIQFNGSNASLKLIANPSQVFSQPFTSSSGFTFNPAATEFVGGSMRQVDTRPANESFYARMTSVATANWGNGSLTGTPTAQVTFGTTGADFSAATGQYIDYVASGGNYTSQVGTTRFRFTPNFSGSSGSIQLIHAAMQIDNSLNGLMAIYLDSFNLITLDLYDSTGILSSRNFLSSYVAVAGVTSEFEIDYDFDAGETRVFLDGTQSGATILDVFTRGPIGVIRFGESYSNFNILSNFAVRDAEFFSTVQHTADYVAPSALPNPTIYIADTVSLPNFTYPGVGNIQSYTASAATDVATPHYTVNGKYWNGSAWIVSNGSYAQSNPIATINTNVPTLTPSNTTSSQVIWNGSNIQMSVDLFTITYSGQIYPTDDPSITVNSGILTDGISAFTSVLSASGSDSIKFILRVQGTDKYWDGATWVTSNGSLAQSNTAAQVNTNAITLDLTAGFTVQLKALLHSATGATTPNITSATITYSFFIAPVPQPNRCIAYLNLNDVIGEIGSLDQALLVVDLQRSFLYGQRIIAPFTRTFAFNEDGYVETTADFLTPSDPTAFDGIVETFSLDLSPYQIGVQYKSGNGSTVTMLTTSNIQIPDQFSVDLSTLLVTG